MWSPSSSSTIGLLLATTAIAADGGGAAWLFTIESLSVTGVRRVDDRIELLMMSSKLESKAFWVVAAVALTIEVENGSKRLSEAGVLLLLLLLLLSVSVAAGESAGDNRSSIDTFRLFSTSRVGGGGGGGGEDTTVS